MIKKRLFILTTIILTAAFAIPAAAAVTVPYETYGVTLDISSAGAFIDDARITYGVVIQDPHEKLAGINGKWMMEDIDYCLALFSPGFMKKVAEAYADCDSLFNIIIETPPDNEIGYISWREDLNIVLYIDTERGINGVTKAVLGHELGHAVHYAAEYIFGNLCEPVMETFNGPYRYMGEDYSNKWDIDEQGAIFAYDYGRFNYYEDIATVFELLIADPVSMAARLADAKNIVLRQKTEFLRDLLYEVFSDECDAVFAPLVVRTPAEYRIVFLNRLMYCFTIE